MLLAYTAVEDQLRPYLFAACMTALLPVSAQVKITPGPDKISVEIDGKPFTALIMPVEGNKPYVYPLSTASGIVVTRHYPMETVEGETHDHPHHRGMFLPTGISTGTTSGRPSRL